MPAHIAGSRIRPATRDDVPELARLLAMLGYAVESQRLAARLDAFHAAGEVALVATDGTGGDGTDDALLGLATLHATPVLHRAGPVGRITALVVDERARGRGVGRALVRAAESWAAARGCVLLEVTSNRARTDAHAFYERVGFESSSVRLVRPLVPRAGDPTIHTAG